MQSFKKIGFAVILGTLGTVGLQAGDGLEYSAKFGWVNSQGDLHTMTKNSTGYGAELGADMVPTKDLGVGLGVYVGFDNIKGKELASRTYTAKNTNFGLDVIYQVGETPLTIRTGPQLASWDITNLLSYAPGDTGAMGETSRYKLGWRLGAEYRITKQWTVSAIYVASTFGQIISPAYAKDALTPEALNDPAGNNVKMKQVHPSYLTIMAGFKF